MFPWSMAQVFSTDSAGVDGLKVASFDTTSWGAEVPHTIVTSACCRNGYKYLLVPVILFSKLAWS